MAMPVTGPVWVFAQDACCRHSRDADLATAHLLLHRAPQLGQRLGGLCQLLLEFRHLLPQLRHLRVPAASPGALFHAVWLIVRCPWPRMMSWSPARLCGAEPSGGVSMTGPVTNIQLQCSAATSKALWPCMCGKHARRLHLGIRIPLTALGGCQLPRELLKLCIRVCLRNQILQGVRHASTAGSRAPAYHYHASKAAGRINSLSLR